VKVLVSILNEAVTLIACGMIAVVLFIGLMLVLFLIGAALDDLIRSFRNRP
jgi:hypothetical protein